MYIAPRPRVEDDPLFPVRLAIMPVICLCLAIVMQTPIPAVVVSLPMGMLAGQRMAFNPTKAMLGPVLFIVLIGLIGGMISLTRSMPLVLLTLIFLVYFVGYYLILRTGNPLGMLILVIAVLMSTMGMYSLTAMEMIRDSFLQASLCSLVLIPLLYLLLPAKTNELFVEDYQPAVGGEYFKRALIRSMVMLALTFWLYSILDVSNLIYAIVAVFVTVFPTRQMLRRELKERVFATTAGGAAALLVLGIFVYVAHLPVLLGMLALLGLFTGSRMMNGRHPPMVYQFAFSVTIALVVGCLTTQAPWDATLLRVGLTIVGALSAAIMTSLLELWLLDVDTLEQVNPRVVRVEPSAPTPRHH